MSLKKSKNIIKSGKEHERIWEIDAFRGIAVILMIFYHVAFDFAYFSTLAEIWNFNIQSSVWNILQSITASLFLIIVGISLYLSWIYKKDKPQQWLLRTIIRGVSIFFLGMIISGITYYLLKERFIQFGILHLIGGCIVLCGLLIYTIHAQKTNKTMSIIRLYLLLASVALLMHITLQAIHPYSETKNVFLLSIGIKPEQFISVDYYPLLPWIGVVIAGLGIGHFLYKQGYFDIKDILKNKTDKYRQVISTVRKTLQDTTIVKFLSLIGRHALLVYFIHQPIILGILYLFGIIPI